MPTKVGIQVIARLPNFKILDFGLRRNDAMSGMQFVTQFHGVFAPNSQHRAQVTPARRGKGNQARLSEETPTPAEQRAAMTWAQRLKRVFNIDIETCDHCGGPVKVIACIEDPVVIKKILDHLKQKATEAEHPVLPESRAPPQGVLFN